MPTVETANPIPSGKCQLGASRLQQYLMNMFHLGNSGCYDPNSRLSGGGPSWHVHGEAIDLTCNWYDPHQRPNGDACFEWVLMRRDELNLQQMIWGNRIYDAHYNAVHGYAHSDHYGHIHIALGHAVAANWAPHGTGATPPKPKNVEEKRMHFIQVNGGNAIAVTDGVTGKRIFKTPHEFATAQFLCGSQGGNYNVIFVDQAYWDALPTLNH